MNVNQPAQSTDPSRKHRKVGTACALVAAGMVGMAYAAVPLYQIFCQTTGYGGTTQVAAAPSEKVLDRTIIMRFDANISKKLAWKFEPVEPKIKLRIGENRIAMYRATNISDKPSTGTASFNVSPAAAGIHFNKIECFCFTEQTLQPGESVEMPVSFYVDAGIVDDPDASYIEQLTLSYTFYPSEPGTPKAGSTAAASGIEREAAGG
ncbi:MAG: cytochrome c oxidase assembly protein [Alphaproteobacteria bacterium]|nr:cytochrome c oxidase assembly protein [Alphaproteobacteria bacterium]